MTEYQRSITKLSGKLGYVSGIGQVMVINDDVVRVRSRNFEMETGMPLVNNPEKGMGAVQNVCVAMPSGFFLGSHFSLKGQGAKEAVKIILLDLAGRGVVLQEQMHGRITNGTGLDRGINRKICCTP